MTTVLPHPRLAARTSDDRTSDRDSDQALRALYRDHAQALLRYAQWFTDDPAAAEDAVQETFLRAWRHLPRLLADGRPLRPWLRRVLRHVMIDADRLARAHRETPHDTMPVEGAVDGGYDSLLDRGLLAVALRELSPAHREVLVQTYYRDAPADQVAALLGVPVGTVRSRLHYALRAVRSSVALIEAPDAL
jgi:RNA polymerase sigma-70 factor (ECF subfamily)